MTSPTQNGSLRLTVGKIPDGREIAVITQGGHPQIKGSGDTTVCALALLDELPNRDAQTWFARMIVERPWETVQ